MNRPTILVTGATGKTGGAVASQLLQLGWPVRALVHVNDARSERLRGQGAEIAVTDLFDPEQLLEAMKGSSRAYYCPPWHPYMLQSAAAFAAAARHAKLEAVVGLSQWLASPSHPSLATRQSWLVDNMFSMLPGVAHTIVNPGFFADNYLRLIGFAAHLGIFPMPTGNSLNAPPSNEDIARVAVAALIEPGRHAGKSYRPTGPALLSARDMAGILRRVLGRRVYHIDMPMWMFLKAMRALGINAFEQSGVRRYIEDHKRGAFEFGAPTNHVLEVTGQTPEDFETIARRYAALPEARRTLGNKLRALGDFMRIGFTPAYNLDRYEREQQHPFPAHPKLAAASSTWREEHEMRLPCSNDLRELAVQLL
jgi:NAD(P)H dehydrogenase (quinone)